MARRYTVFLAILLCAFLLADWLLRSFVILPGFLDLERDEAQRDVARCMDAIRHELAGLARTTVDYAVWDETYRFVEDRNAGFIEQNLDWNHFTSRLGVHFACIVNTAGDVLWCETHPPAALVATPLPGFPTTSLGTDHPIVAADPANKGVGGILNAPHGPILIASHPICRNRSLGPTRGRFILGRFLDQPLVRRLAHSFHVPFRVHPLPPDGSAPPGAPDAPSLAPGHFDVRVADEMLLRGYGCMPDLTGHPGLLIEANIPRVVMARGQSAAATTTFTLALASLAIAGIGLVLTQKSVSLRARTRELLASQEETRRRERAHRDWLQALVRSIPNPLFAKDREGRYNLVNPAFERFHGASAERLIGKTVHECWPRADAEIYHRRDLELIARDEVQHYEYQVTDASGKRRDVHFTKACYHADDGSVAGMIGTFLDITDIKEAERERQRLENRTQQSKKLESLGLIAGGIAHDFNNLLVAILGHAELALDGTPPGTSQHASVEEIRRAAIRASELTNQILAFAGKGHFLVRAVCLNDVVRETTRLLDGSRNPKIEYVYDLEPDLPHINADVAQIGQVILNLLTNAAESIGDGGGTIRLQTRSLVASEPDLAETQTREALAPGRYVSLSVRDSGCGMDPETQAKMFDPFFSTKFLGRGLGLAAALGIVRGHHGAIRVESEPGRGTLITILLPADPDAPGETAQAQEADLQDWRDSGRILVVDDEEPVRDIASLNLARHGFEVLTATDGCEAIEIFRQNPDGIRAVLLDMTMPRLNGEETFRLLREIRPDVRVILTSGYDERDATVRFAGLGLAGFLHKPFQRNALLAVLRKALDA